MVAVKQFNMKKNIITAGVLAAGVASLYAENVTGLTEMQQSKPWNVSGSVRGFYDSNPEIQSEDSNPEGSWGVSITPTVGFNHSMENTLFSASLAYTALWFANRDDNQWDQQFVANGRVNHKFNEHTSLNVEDTFIISDMPAVTDVGNFTQPLQRSDNSYLQNTFPIDFMTKFSERFGINVGYKNTYYNYQDDVYAAQLNRVENLAHIDLDYYLQEQIILLVGYQFGLVDYLSDDDIFTGDPIPPGGLGTPGKDRSNLSHYFYVGGQAALSTQLKASLKLGAVYTDWYDLDQDDWSPYVDGNVSYTYLPGCYFRAGITMSHNAMDVVQPNSAGEVTLDQDSVIPYVALTHAITPRLTLNLLGQIQFSMYDGGEFDGDVDHYYTFGASLKYLLTKHVFSEVSYNYDFLSSDVPGREFDRNRIFFGGGVTY